MCLLAKPVSLRGALCDISPNASTTLQAFEIFLISSDTIVHLVPIDVRRRLNMSQLLRCLCLKISYMIRP